MYKLLGAAILIFLVNSLIAQPLRFYDKADSVNYTALDASADDRGGWLTIGTSKDSSFSIIQFDYCGKIITNEKYALPERSKLTTPQIFYLGKDTSLVIGTLNTSTNSSILVFYSVGGIISQGRLLATVSFSHNYNPVISPFDHDNILLAFNYDADSSKRSRILMLDKKLNVRWSKDVSAQSQIRWVKMLNNKEFVIGDGFQVRKFDTLGTNLWSRTFPEQQMVYNSILRQDSSLVFLTDYIDPVVDTVKKLKYKQVISLDLRGKLKWESSRIRNIKNNYLLENNSRLFFDNKKNYVFNAIDTATGVSIPSVFAHTIDINGNLVSSVYWSAKDSVIDYKSTILDDGNYGVSISLGNKDTLKGFANIKANMQYEGACGDLHESNIITQAVLMDSIGVRNIPDSAVTVKALSIIGHHDSMKLNRVCEIFDLKDGKVPTPLCKGDSVFLAGASLKNATYQWNNGSKEIGIWVKVAGDYSEKITYCDKTITITYMVFYISYPDEVIAMEECDYPIKLDAFRGRSNAKYLWNNGDSTRLLEINGPGTYTVNVTQCEMTFKITFNVSLKKFKDQTFDYKICDYPAPLYAYQGDSIKGATYKWDDGSTDATHSVNGPGTYKVTVSYCQSMFVQTFNITLPEFPDQTLNFTICDYPNTLYAFQGPGIHGATYQWDDGSTNNLRQITDPGTYVVTIHYCLSVFKQTFVITTLNLKDSIHTFNQCNFPDMIYADLGRNYVGASFLWDNGSTNNIREISGQGTYNVTVTYCRSTYKQTIIVTHEPFLDSIATIPPICDYPAPIYADLGRKFVGAVFKWDDGSTNNLRQISGPGTYVATVTYCESTYKQTIIVNTIQLHDSLAPPYTLCKPDTYYADLGGSFTGVKYLWDNGSTSNARLIDIPGTYKVTISKCNSSYVRTFVISKASALDIPDVEKIDSCKNFPVDLVAFSDPKLSGLTYKWSTGDSTIFIKAPKSGVYTVDIDYCFTTYQQKFTVKEKNEDYLQFPNVFPPNSEIVVNKIFKPLQRDTAFIADYSLEIYNRWGQQVFSSNDPDKGWDGNYKGEAAPMDTYMYVATMRSSCGAPKGIKGSVTLVR